MSFGLTGCAERVVTKLDVCKGWSPILVSKDDVLSDQTAKQILQLNLYGVSQGCWPASKKKGG